MQCPTSEISKKFDCTIDYALLNDTFILVRVQLDISCHKRASGENHGYEPLKLRKFVIQIPRMTILMKSPTN